MKKYVNRKRAEVNNYKVEDLVMLSTKDLKYQMVRRRTEKLTEKFVGPYKIKKIVSLNAVELKLPSTIMNIEWDYNYYQPWSDNEWIVDEMLAMLDEDIIM